MYWTPFPPWFEKSCNRFLVSNISRLGSFKNLCGMLYWDLPDWSLTGISSVGSLYWNLTILIYRLVTYLLTISIPSPTTLPKCRLNVSDVYAHMWYERFTLNIYRGNIAIWTTDIEWCQETTCIFLRYTRAVVHIFGQQRMSKYMKLFKWNLIP